MTTEFRAFNGSEEDVTLISTLWKDIFVNWPIAQGRLTSVLNFENGNHILHPHGFCISYMSSTDEGNIACVGVSKEHRRKGLGTSLVKAAYGLMESKVPGGTKIRYEINSQFPRFWPGMFLSSCVLYFQATHIPYARA